jgi:hypothetical protein
MVDGSDLANGFLRLMTDKYRAGLLACLLVLVAAVLWGALPLAAAIATMEGTPRALGTPNDSAERSVLPAGQPMAKVPRAALVERLTVACSWALPLGRRSASSTATESPCDRRRDLRRVQTRRRVPRMNSEEPPWA